MEVVIGIGYREWLYGGGYMEVVIGSGYREWL